MEQKNLIKLKINDFIRVSSELRDLVEPYERTLEILDKKRQDLEDKNAALENSIKRVLAQHEDYNQHFEEKKKEANVSLEQQKRDARVALEEAERSKADAIRYAAQLQLKQASLDGKLAEAESLKQELAGKIEKVKAMAQSI